MEILEKNGKFIVEENGIELYIALTQDEAQGYIDWKLRPDAGNSNEDCGCSDPLIR